MGWVLTPTNFAPELTLAATMYRLALGVTYVILEDFFGFLIESGCTFLNKVIRHIVAYFQDEYVKLYRTDEEWEAEVSCIYRKLKLANGKTTGWLTGWHVNFAGEG